MGTPPRRNDEAATAPGVDVYAADLSPESESSPQQLRRLEDRVSVSKILSGMTTPPSNGDAAAPPDGGNGGVAGEEAPPMPSRGRVSADDCSALTDDSASVLSSLGRARESIGSVLRESMMILRGEDPLGEDDDDEGSAGSGGSGRRRTMPVNSLMMPSIPSEREFVDEEKPAEDGDGDGGAPRAVLDMDDADDGRSDATEETIDFLADDRSEMTYSRRIALYLMRKNWYYPRPEGDGGGDGDDDGTRLLGSPATTAEGDGKAEGNGAQSPSSIAPSVHTGRVVGVDEMNKPNLEKAWAYFEHVTLPRYILRDKGPGWKKKSCCVRIIRKLFLKANKKLDRAEPGERHEKTRLYSPIFTPLKQMGDFGLGIGLYFSTLRAITVMTFIAGIINIPNFIYFHGPDYSGGQPGVINLLKGSAICTEEDWVPCPNCTREDFSPGRFAVATDEAGNTLTFARQNMCERPPLMQGMINYGTLAFVTVAICCLHVYQKQQEIAFDEDEQTTQDYSIVVTNPPGEATEPEEWKMFFEDNFDNVHVTCCTVGIDNDLLVKSLVQRRETLHLLQIALPPGTSLDVLNLAKTAAEIETGRRLLGQLMAYIVPGVPEHFGRLAALNAKIQGLAQQSYPASNVFVTFETEAAQRQVLSALTVSPFDVMRNNTNSVRKKAHLFRGRHVLNVSEANEPSTVRWQDLNEKLKQRLKQLAITTFVTFCAVALVAFIVKLCRNVDTTFGAYAIAGFNALFPMFAKLLTNLESHASEGDKQASLYFKITLFRWVNTAIVITIIMPFTSTVSIGEDHLLAGVSNIFFAEIVTTNAIQLGDPVGHLQRHILAPRAKTQEAMNLQMQGQVYELAERYTNMTKILFLALWYCAIYPGALFLCSLALFINFFTDRFSLMRTWKPAPRLGTRISHMSRKYFLSLAIVAMALVGSYYWAGFPFDNVCVNDDSVDISNYQGTWIVNSEVVDVNSTHSVRYCNQDLLRMDDVVAFPAHPKYQPEGDEWMTKEQEHLTTIYGWTSVAVLACVCIVFLGGIVVSFQDLFRGRYKPSGKDMGVNFSDVSCIAAYIPEVNSNLFSYPLLAADVDGLDDELFEWHDPDKPYSHYDLTRDAELLLRGHDCTKDASKNVFTKIRHWPPIRCTPEQTTAM